MASKIKKNSDLNKEHKCPYADCSKKFNRPYRLKQHIAASHTLLPQFECPETGCERTYASKYKLHLHLRKQHNTAAVNQCAGSLETEKAGGTTVLLTVSNGIFGPAVKEITRSKIKCNDVDCKKVFANTHSMKKHYKIYHSGIKSNLFICDSCDQKFKSRGGMQEHWNIHLEIPELICQYCPKKFTSRTKFRKHAAKHKEIKCPLQQCSQLPPLIGKLAFLKHNALIHEATFSCEHCHKNFMWKFQLARHINATHLHAVEAGPFPCSYCSRKYSFKKNLSHHIQVKHQNLRIPCQQCDKTFVSNQKLQSHMKSHETKDSRPRRKYPRGAERKRRKDAGILKRTVSQMFFGRSTPCEDEA